MEGCLVRCSRFHVAQMATLEAFVAFRRGGFWASAWASPQGMFGSFTTHHRKDGSTKVRWQSENLSHDQIMIMENYFQQSSDHQSKLHEHARTFFLYLICWLGLIESWHIITSRQAQFWSNQSLAELFHLISFIQAKTAAVWRWSEGELARCYYQKTITIRVNKSCNNVMMRCISLSWLLES